MKVWAKKRGQAELPYAIIAVAAIIITVLFVHNYSKAFDDEKEIQACRLSVLQNAKLRPGTVGEAVGIEFPTPELTAIDCPKRKLEISSRLVDKYKQGPEYGAKLEIAEAMRKCWKQWLGPEGFAPFDTGWLEGDKRFCAICYDVSFADDFQNELKIKQLNNFVEFLRTTYTPDGSYRYVNYLTNTNWSFSLPPGSSEQFNDAMSTEQDYVVMYRVDRKGYWLGSIIGSTAVSSGCIAGTWAGGPTGFVIGCGLGLIGGGIGYVTATEDLHHEASIVVKPSHLIREDGCKVLYQ